MRFIKLLFLGSMLVLLNACATPYQPKGLLGGYSDARLDENTVRVTFEGNGDTAKNTVQNAALYRSAEVTLQYGYDYFEIISGKTHKDITTHTTPDSYSEYTTKEKKHGKTKEVKHEQFEPGSTYDVESFDSSMVIKMFHGKKPATVNGFDAHQIIQYLTPSVKPAG